MSVQLLDRTRKINKLLHNSSSSKVVFNDICQVLMETLSSNILVLSKKGKVLGVSLCPGVEEITELIEDKVGGYVDSLLNERFLGVLSTKENVNLQTLGFEHVSSSYQGIINPIDIAGDFSPAFTDCTNTPYARAMSHFGSHTSPLSSVSILTLTLSGALRLYSTSKLPNFTIIVTFIHYYI